MRLDRNSWEIEENSSESIETFGFTAKSICCSAAEYAFRNISCRHGDHPMDPGDGITSWPGVS